MHTSWQPLPTNTTFVYLVRGAQRVDRLSTRFSPNHVKENACSSAAESGTKFRPCEMFEAREMMKVRTLTCLERTLRILGW